jgi:hypothetical protein
MGQANTHIADPRIVLLHGFRYIPIPLAVAAGVFGGVYRHYRLFILGRVSHYQALPFTFENYFFGNVYQP